MAASSGAPGAGPDEPPLPGAPQAGPACSWVEGGQVHHAAWRSENGAPVPALIQPVGDELSADDAWHAVQAGTALLWRGDFHNARLLLQALGRRADRPPRNPLAPPSDALQAWQRQREAQARRAALLSRLLIEVAADRQIALRRAPDLRAAVAAAWGEPQPAAAGAALVSLRELLAVNSAWEWRKAGVPIAALGGQRIHPHYGVFSPVRGEYLDLVARVPLPALDLAVQPVFDIGTGSGVIAAILARRGCRHIVATDVDPRALACAADNWARLGVADVCRAVRADLYPPAELGQAALVVCNPPWVPATPHTPIEAAVYDPDSRMLRGFLAGLRERLLPAGEGWLILSDLAEHLGLRSREDLRGWIRAAGLKVRKHHEIRPRHPKASDPNDPLHQARAAEVTMLWRLVAA